MCYLFLDIFGLFYSQNILFWRRLRCTFLFLFLSYLSLFSLSIYAALCFLNWSSLIVSTKRNCLCIYNPFRQLNSCCIKSKNIWLRFIASSFQTSMSYFSRLIAILYCSNNSSLFTNLNAWFTDIIWIFFNMKVIWSH